MDHGKALPNATADPHRDPGDFVAEEKRIKAANPNYVGVFIVLGILTLIEIGITVLFPGEDGAIATVGRVPLLLFLTVAKALFVILYYMHLKFDNRIYSFFFGAGVLAFALPMVLAILFLMAPPQLTSVRHSEGGEPVGGEERPTPNPNAGPPITLAVQAGDFFFNPDQLQANNGQVVRIELTNDTGSVEHNFVMPDVTIEEEPEPWITNNGKLIARALPSSTGRGGFTAPAPGQYAFYCNIPGHAALGMHGIFTVQ